MTDDVPKKRTNHTTTRPADLPATFQRRCCACKQIFTTHDLGQVQCDRCDELQMVMP